MRLMRAVLVGLALAAGASAQPCCTESAIARNPVVELKGTILRVQIARGEGMPFLEVREGGQTVKVYLGSIRYLMEQDFTPKAGEEVVVKGYKTNADVVAITVKVGSSEKTLRLRDDSGRPMWRGGPRGRWARPSN